MLSPSSPVLPAQPELTDPARFTYASLDYRGHGDRMSVPGRGQYSIAEISGDSLALADELGWDRFCVVGHSMGDMAAQRMLVDAPARVEKLVGISPVPAGDVPLDDQGWALFDGAAGDPEARRTILDFTTGGRLSRHWRDRVVAFSPEHSVREAFAAYLVTWARTDVSAEVKGGEVTGGEVTGGEVTGGEVKGGEVKGSAGRR